MVSISKSDSSVEQRILDAAAACIVAYGIERTTVTEIARRARVSRPTIYRRWPDIRWVIAELLTVRITGVLEAVPAAGAGREDLVNRVVRIAERLRSDEVVMSVIFNAPTLAMVYITERLGTSQQLLVDTLADAIAAGQEHGSVRPGDPHQMGAMCLLITQSTIQSAQMVEKILDRDALNAELALALNGYLKP
ncbi:TetR/AcrR family transcriptional regulator [Mycolicibacterium parafortuitum]|uniref:Putative transcriptional regulatory protein [Mycobacterium tuberculosis H37Rv] n=1 Tax=Mycolicibacterium parafortuitum TaxID=39692 RepID=A0A375YPB3_MYCPF|nr:TetR/AcrR family transcriptional regulator [Mycolicibacterium parafortuitum]ORB25846.1 TetR family transcriptional regulator [Mycolicibacterium parafortuitum]SRX82834.1 putative transcriptional regulatory protein [Mycobacterium tuberculosis H37Rv] [Mycolicibacterium parafortuitum]